MVWNLEINSTKGSVWLDSESERFIILSPIGSTKWCVKIGVKSSTLHNQECTYKNRSRAMIRVNGLMKSKKWIVSH